ncbi:hypothetical protein QBC44DRAFT_305448 [Cladorrhinum sp. PSN332]|nr:hypothetical protein QBC44DRAFT_305448 [Cladorrhinum sp. PSN332]
MPQRPKEALAFGWQCRLWGEHCRGTEGAVMPTVLNAAFKRWDDILSVKNIFVNMTTRGMSVDADGAFQLEQKAQDFFGDMRLKLFISNCPIEGVIDGVAGLKIVNNMLAVIENIATAVLGLLSGMVAEQC